MSQALQSLNSLLKYKQERERQKIDKSLSMMDMATRLRQQQLENTRQNQIMQMRVKQENRDSKLFSKQLESAELALEKERRESTPEYIAFQKREIEAEIKNAELNAEIKHNALVKEEFDTLKASIDSKSIMNKQNIVQDFKENLGMSPIFKAIRDFTDDGEFPIDEKQKSIENLSKYVKDKKQLKLIKKILKEIPSLTSGISSYQMLKDKGSLSKQTFESLFESMNTFYNKLNANPSLVTEFENTFGIDSDKLQMNSFALQKNQRSEQIFESGRLNSQILDIVSKNLKNKGQDKNTLKEKYMLDVFSTLDLIATKEQRDAINEQRRSEGKKEIPLEDFTTGKF